MPGVLMVQMTVVHVVHVTSMDHSGVAAAGPVGVTVGLGGRMAGISAHDISSGTGDCWIRTCGRKPYLLPDCKSDPPGSRQPTWRAAAPEPRPTE